MIKAIIFDLGGVVLNMEPFLARIQKDFQTPDKYKLRELLNIEAVPLCKGEISLLQFWRRVAKKLGKKIPDNILKDLWIKDYEKLTSVNKRVEKFISSLKKNYKIAIISNTIKEHAKINKKLGRFKLFDVVILSHKYGLAKNKKGIFLLAVKKINVKPEECIFIDDTKRFLETANDLGMKTIHFKNPMQLKKELKSLGVLL